MASGQFGGGKLGGVALSNGAMVPQDFRAMPHVCVRDLMLTVNLSVRNNAAATTALVISTAGSASAEGVDDLDLILNALFTALTLFWDEQTMGFSLTPAQLRTVIGLINQRDLAGAIFGLTVAASVPSSGSGVKATSVVFQIPVALTKYFEDGDIFKNGARRLSGGQLQYSCGANIQGTTAVVCANATINVTAVSVNLYALAGSGSENDVGSVWKVERKANLPTIYEFDDRPRLAMLDVTPAATNAVSSYNIGPYGLVDPTTLQAKFQMDMLTAGGFDITARVTPLIVMDRSRKFMDFQAMLGSTTKIEAISGVASLTLYDILAIPPTAEAVQNVAQRAGAGGPVTIQHPTPHSLPPGFAIPRALVESLSVRVQPGGVGGNGGSAHEASDPAAAAGRVMANKAAARKAGSIFRAIKK